MRLRAISAQLLRVPLSRPYAIAGGAWDAAEMVVVQLVSDTGLVGHGVAAPAEEVTGETCAGALAALEGALVEALGGLELEHALQRLPSLAAGPAAQAAVDMALHDLLARGHGLSVVDHLGRVHDALPTSVTIGVKDTEATLAEAEPFGDALELEVRSLIVSLLSGDERAVMEERLALGRVLVQLGRPALALEVLGHAVRYHARDETRFRERLEGAVWLARALDQLGSVKAALETLDQPRLVEDARIFGRETLLVREYETLRTTLRTRVER